MKKIKVTSIEALVGAEGVQIQLPSNLNKIKIIDATLSTKIVSNASESVQVNYAALDKNGIKQSGWENVDVLSVAAENKYEIDISDEIQNAIEKKCYDIRLNFVCEDTTMLSFSDNSLEISYISLSEYKENGSTHQIELGKGGTASVDLETGQMDVVTTLINSDSNVLPVTIVANYSNVKTDKMPDIGMPQNWSLNVNQFLVDHKNKENLEFTYLDEAGKEQIIEEKYYILEQDEKRYIDRKDLSVSLDGSLTFEGNEVKTELIAPSGMKLISSIEGLKGYQQVDYEPEELADVKLQIKSLKENISDIDNNIMQNKKQLCVMALTKEMLRQQLSAQEISILDTEKQIELQEKVETIHKKSALQNRYFRLNTNDKNDGIKIKKTENEGEGESEAANTEFNVDNAAAKTSLGSQAITLSKINELFSANYEDKSNVVQGSIVSNESSIIYTFGFPENEIPGTLSSQKANNSLNKAIYSNEVDKQSFMGYIASIVSDEDEMDIDSAALWESFKYELNNNKKLTLGYKDFMSVDAQIESLKYSIKTYSQKVQEYRDMLDKYCYQQKQYEAQVPVHYLLNDDNIVYGFGKTYDEHGEETNLYRLILISDAYENTIFLSYEDLISHKIKSITDAANQVIVFNYKNERLNSILDARDRKVTLDFSDNLHIITHVDDTKSYYYITENNLLAIMNENGFGAKFTYEDEKVTQIDSISALQKVKNGEVILKDNVQLASITDFDVLKKSGEKIELKYNNHQSTSVINEKGKIVTYVFDKFGRVRSVYENAFVETDEEIRTNATEFHYQDKNKFEKISTLQYAKNVLKDLAFTSSSKSQMSGLYLGDCVCSDTTIPYVYEVITQIHTIDADNLNKQDTVSLTNFDLMQDACLHKTYILSGWAKANSAFVITDEDSDHYPQYIKQRKFELRAEIKYANEPNPVIFKKCFDWRNTDWQYCAAPVQIDSDKEIEKIDCFVDYSHNTGSIIFSALELKEGEFEKVDYDNFNRPIKKYSGHSDLVATYDYEDDTTSQPSSMTITNLRTKERFETLYEYNKQGSLLRSIDFNGIVKENVYNEKGQVMTSKTYHKDEPTNIFYQESVLDEKGQEVKTVNELGEEIRSAQYVEGTGIVSAQTDKNGVKTVYGYAKDGTLLETSVTVDGIENTNTYGYNLDFLTSLKHNDFEIGYDYDCEGRIDTINIAGREYLSKTYGEHEETTHLANGEKFRQTFNEDGKVLEMYYTTSPTAEDGMPQEVLLTQNIYNSYGDLIDTKDYTNLTQYKKSIDKFGNVYKEESIQHGETFVVENQYDDSHTNVDCSVISIGAEDLVYCYERDHTPDGRLLSVTLPNNEEQIIGYDKLQRVSKMQIGNISKKYTYLKSGDHASNLISKVDFAVDGINKDSLKYAYDEKGNITEIRTNQGLLFRYKYDGLSRLIREDNKLAKKTCTFDYDGGGNITCRTEYDFMLSENLDYESGTPFLYTYSATGWRDQLREYNGQKFAYDALGNPTLYRDKPLTWSHGRQLDKFADLATYTYNANGIRTSKHGNFTTSFYLSGTKILAQKDALNTMYFHYGVDGLTGFSLNGTEYLYKKNAQNDIVGIYSTNGTEIAKYTYDAWGNFFVEYLQEDGTFVRIKESDEYQEGTNGFVAKKNPFRYRGYYYDEETNLYYLNSRYYDPELGRFINADDISILSESFNFINGLNLYTYCSNNPIVKLDSSGNWWFFDDLIAAIVGLFIGIIGQFVSDLVSSLFTGKWQFSSWETYVGAAIGGMLGGMASLYLGPVAGAAIGSGLSTFMGQGLESLTGTNNRSFADIILNSFFSAGLGALSAGAAKYVKIPGITSGSHSFSQIWASGITKSLKYGFDMSIKTILKGFVAESVKAFTVGWLLSSIFSGAIGALKINFNNFKLKNGIV